MEYLSYDFKVQRAREHLKLLQKELRSSLGGSDAYEIVDESENVEITDETRRIRLTRSVVFNKDVPVLRLGVLIGDVVSNLRSALDHVVYAISFSKNPDEFRDDWSTEFPICVEPRAFTSDNRQEKIRGIPPVAKAIIEGLQPYNGREHTYEPLWILREMSNIDKHRRIHIATYSGAEISLDISKVDPRVTIHSHSVRPPGIVESGAVLAEMEITGPKLDITYTAMHTNRKFFFTVAFDYDTPLPGIWVIEGLSDLIDYVEGVVGALDRFVKRP